MPIFKAGEIRRHQPILNEEIVMMKIRPLHDRVVVERLEEKARPPAHRHSRQAAEKPDQAR